MERKRIYLSSPTMHGEEQAFVQSAFDTNWVAPLGPNVDAFEKEMADYIGGGYAAALSAGTAAIHLAVILAGVKEGDVVFAQSLTFAASVNPACYEKAKPVWIELGLQSIHNDTLRQIRSGFTYEQQTVSRSLYIKRTYR